MSELLLSNTYYSQETQRLYVLHKGGGKHKGMKRKTYREKKKAPHNFPTHKESDFDKWLF